MELAVVGQQPQLTVSLSDETLGVPFFVHHIRLATSPYGESFNSA